MANYANLKATINANIKANGTEAITGPVLNSVLTAAVNTLGAGYQFMGVATTSTNPGTPDANVFYIAATPGTYTNFGGKTVADGEVAILKYNGSWTKEVTGAATAAQLTQLGQSLTSVDAIGAGNTLVSAKNEVRVLPGHIYRVFLMNPSIPRNGITYTSATYDILSMSILDASSTAIISPVRIGANKKNEAFADYYDLICPDNARFIRFRMRANSGEMQSFWLFDITSEYEIPINSVVGYIRNDGTVAYSGIHNRVAWYRLRPHTKVSITSYCIQTILGKCDKIGADTGIIPIIDGVSSNEVSASVFFQDETIIAITYVDNDPYFSIAFENESHAFADAFAGKNLIQIFEDGDISGIGLMRKTPVFDTALATNYFEIKTENGLTGNKSIKITGKANRAKTIQFVAGHAYAIIMTLRCDAFTPVVSSFATGYQERGGGVVGFLSDADKFDELQSWHFLPTIADKKYHTIIVFANCNTSGSYAVYFGTKNPDDGSIAGTFYMDNAFVVDMSALFGVAIPKYTEFVAMFGKYLQLYTEQDFVNQGYSDGEMKESFIAAMNRKATYLGMNGTSFSNPGGTDEVDNYFTANDALKMLCALHKTPTGLLLSSIPDYTIHIGGDSARDVTVSATYKGAEQVSRLNPYTIVAGKTGTLNADSHADVGGENMNTANVGLIVKSPTDGELLAGVVILPLTKDGNSWKTQDGDTSPYNSRYSVLKQLFDLLERARDGEDVSSEVNALGCGYAAACVVPRFLENVGEISLIQKNGNGKCFPASMTKLMALLVVMDNADVDKNITIYGSDVMGGSGADFQGGDVLKIGDAIIGMMLPSANTLASTFSRVFGLKFLTN